METMLTHILEDLRENKTDGEIKAKYKLTVEQYNERLRAALGVYLDHEIPKRNLKAPKSSPMNDWFHQVAKRIADTTGSPWAFITASVVLVIWAVSGPIFHYSDTWQLIINTATTIITFLMVFLIQNTQNRSDKATQLKLDELIRSVEGARTGLVNLETRTDEEIDGLQEQFKELAEQEPNLIAEPVNTEGKKVHGHQLRRVM